MGHVILVGRGANIITSRLDNMFHVRLIGSLEQRIARVCGLYQLDEEAAQEYIRKEDEGRRRYLKRYFDKDMDDPLQYHLTLNTDRFTHEETAQLIGEAVAAKFREK
jgi:cytidylate kinase